MAFAAVLFIFTVCTNYGRADDSQRVGGPKVLVIFSSKNNEYDEHQRMLDMLLGHFTENIKFVSSLDIQKSDLEQVDYLFYYGQQREFLSKSLVKIVTEFEEVFVAIGHNVEQFEDRFSFLEWAPYDVVIDQAYLVNNPAKQLSFIPQYVLNVNLVKEEQTEVVLNGKRANEEVPIFINNQIDYYFASNLLKPPFSILFAEALNDIFAEEYVTHSDTTLGYIRLEDIHPLVDPDHMMDIANVLVEKNIPYMMAVIPVYTNPETKKQYHLSDSPNLLKALKFMQDNGGSIVLHGYTHQFRLSETGEGFEFWDVENNMPIYHGPEDEINVATEEDFKSNDEYEKYVSAQKAYERNYIEKRLAKGIHELANYGLYPLAFEAPHYTMSQHGYEIASEYFTSYVGQLQLSDQDWEIMTTSPYMTKPTFLHGMQLLPETIGYVDPDDPEAIEKMINKAKDYQFVNGGMIAGFYHPYLGVDLFIELLDELEKIEHISWIDLKQMNHRVKTDYVDIRSDNGEIIVDINYLGLFMSSFDYLNYHLKKVITIILWCIACIGLIAVANFTFHILSNRHSQHRTKRRNSVG